MDFRLSDEQTLLRRSVREFAESEIKPHVMEWDEAQALPRDLFRKLADLGVMGIQFAPEYGGWRTSGDEQLLEPAQYPNGLERAWCALACPNAGEVIASAAPGWEFEDLGGRHHAGGGSHGSLLAGDSIVPIIAAGFEEGSPLPADPSVTDLAPLALAHFGVELPASMRAHVRSGV